MAPLRRYLRITPSSVLEVRIYSQPPGPWLLSPRPLLQQVLAAVRPLILPKLREENERIKARGRGKWVKDVVIGDGFEVAVFLTETSTRHTVLKRRKIFREPKRRGSLDGAPAALLREESDDVVIQDVPAAIIQDEDEDAALPPRRSKRTRVTAADEADSLFVADSDAESDLSFNIHDSDAAPPSKRAREDTTVVAEEDEKKMAMRSEYDGYAIYGRVLCLIVTKTAGKSAAVGGGGKAVMEEWIASTQNPAGEATEG